MKTKLWEYDIEKFGFSERECRVTGIPRAQR